MAFFVLVHGLGEGAIMLVPQRERHAITVQGVNVMEPIARDEERLSRAGVDRDVAEPGPERRPDRHHRHRSVAHRWTVAHVLLPPDRTVHESARSVE